MRRTAALLLILTACSPAVVAETAGPTAAPTTTAPPAPASTTSAAPTTTATTTTTSSTTTTTAADPLPNSIFAWMPGGLSDDFFEIVADVPGVQSVGLITTVTMHIVTSQRPDGTIVDEPRTGYVIPLHGAIVPAAALPEITGARGINRQQLVLGDQSAELRRLDVGDSITFETGATLEVGAIVDEDLMAGYEAIAISDDHFEESRMEARALHVLYRGDAGQLELKLKPHMGDQLYAVIERDRSADRGGLVVRSQVFIKQIFGEFAYRVGSGGRFTIDPDWVETNIVEERIPLIGRAKCHKVTTRILTEIMQDLIDNGLEDVIERRRFAGCWNARYIAGSSRISRHAFGAAVDINFFNSLDGGPGSPVNEELLSRMYAAGMTSGHVWTNADPGHFEYFGFPEAQPTPP